MKNILLAFLATAYICIAIAAPAYGNGNGSDAEAPSGTEPGAEELYKSVFRRGLHMKTRKRILREVIRKHPDSRWTDDALWMLGRIAEMQGDRARAIMWRRRLIEDFPKPVLENFSTEQVPYRTSSIPGILRLVETTGYGFAHDSDTVYSFNPVPFSVHYELGVAYQEMGYYELAENEYRRALRHIAPEGVLRGIIGARMESLGRVMGTTAERNL